MQLKEGTKVYLTTGDVFIIDNSMSRVDSCTIWDVDRFVKEGLLLTSNGKVA